jgi:hypothetical protein
MCTLSVRGVLSYTLYQNQRGLMSMMLCFFCLGPNNLQRDLLAGYRCGQQGQGQNEGWQGEPDQDGADCQVGQCCPQM